MEKTYSDCLCKLNQWDHLHIRGENNLQHMLALGYWGSPPHTWRKRTWIHAKWCPSRITSTYVEKTNSLISFLIVHKDHLHIRGENLSKLVHIPARPGSPPHTWRKPKLMTMAKRLKRITSTYVEKTYFAFQSISFLWDHLHIRGENSKRQQRKRVTSGSPPHTWRKH